MPIAEKPTLELDHRWTLAFVPPRVEALARHAEMLMHADPERFGRLNGVSGRRYVVSMKEVRQGEAMHTARDAATEGRCYLELKDRLPVRSERRRTAGQTIVLRRKERMLQSALGRM